MNRGFRAIAGGIAGTAVLVFLLLLLEVETRKAVIIFDAVAVFVGVPGNRAVGFALFVLAGCVAWPLVYVAIDGRLRPGDAAPRGMAFGGVLWVGFVVIGGAPIGGAIFLVFAGYTLLAHLAYGFTLGLVFDHFDAEVTA